MPNPGTLEAYEKLTGCQNRLREVAAELRRTFAEVQANRKNPGEFKNADRRYTELQREWDFAFREFTSAMDEFSGPVSQFQLQLEALKSTSSRK